MVWITMQNTGPIKGSHKLFQLMRTRSAGEMLRNSRMTPERLTTYIMEGTATKLNCQFGQKACCWRLERYHQGPEGECGYQDKEAKQHYQGPDGTANHAWSILAIIFQVELHYRLDSIGKRHSVQGRLRGVHAHPCYSKGTPPLASLTVLAALLCHIRIPSGRTIGPARLLRAV